MQHLSRFWNGRCVLLLVVSAIIPRILRLSNISKELKRQRDRLDSAVMTLQGRSPNQRTQRQRRRILSEEAQLRISAGMKARWAKATRAG